MNTHYCDICEKRLTLWNRAFGRDRCRECQRRYPYRHSAHEAEIVRQEGFAYPLPTCLWKALPITVIYLGLILLGQWIGGIFGALGMGLLAILLIQGWRVINPEHVLNAARLRNYFEGLVWAFWVSLAALWVLAGCAVDSCAPAVAEALPRMVPLQLWWLPALIGMAAGLLLLAARDADLRREVADIFRLAQRSEGGPK